MRGRLAVYEPRGELQLVVESMQRVGAGALYEQFLRLKARLEAAGPVRRGAQARHRRRGRGARRRHLHRGGRAARRADRAGAARAAGARGALPEPGAGRRCGRLAGGGAAAGGRRGARSTRCCWCAAAVRWRTCGPSTTRRWCVPSSASPIPVVCGVGHETDVTLADLAADLRAATPTAAAELAAPARAEALARLDALADRLQRRVHHWSDTQAQRLDALALRLGGPARALATQRQALATLGRSACAGACATAWPSAAQRPRAAGRAPGARHAAPARAAGPAAAGRDAAAGGAGPAARAGARLCVGGRCAGPAGRCRCSGVGSGARLDAVWADGSAPRRGAGRCGRRIRRRRRRHRRGRLRGRAQRAYNAPASTLPRRPSRRGRIERTLHGTHPARIALCAGRAGAALQQGNAGVPPRQASQRLRGQPEQPAEGHRVRIDGARGHRQEVLRRHLQQLRADLEPHLLLELHEARTAAASRPVRWPRRSTPSGAPTRPSAKPS